MNKHINDNTFVVVDVETTGTSRNDRICEIGMTKIAGGEIADKLETLIDPDLSITNTIYHGVEDWMVEDAPSFSDIAWEVKNFINGAVLVAHNAPFDMRFLRYELQRLDSDLSHHALCTLKIARELHPDFSNHRLEYLLERYRIRNVCPHRAGSDADAEASLFLEMSLKMQKNGFETLKSLKAWGLPYNHVWCEEIKVRQSENGRMLTRDDLV
jgi:DNA polymerase-3 subunit alpha (Gram-positive type)